jgi:hypothetical protein
MKTKNMRDLQRHWAEQRKKAAKAAKVNPPTPAKNDGGNASKAPAEPAQQEPKK